MVIPLIVDQKRQPGEASRSGGFAAGVATLVVMQANPFRKEASITNDALNPVYISKSDLAAINTGIRLAPGESMVIKPDSTGRIYVGPLACITTVGAQNLCFTEDW